VFYAGNMCSVSNFYISEIQGGDPVTTKSALLVIDVQVGMFDESFPVYNGEALLTKIRMLIDQAREAGVPVVFVRHGEGAGQQLESGTPMWQVHPSLGPLPDDVFIDKLTPDSFHETALQRELETRGVQKLVLTGIQTEVCVDTTCRRAFSLGYDVTLVSDAHSTYNSTSLSAQQIIDHHNEVLGSFADAKESSNITL
jgi:nicotinamidase-related amidase